MQTSSVQYQQSPQLQSSKWSQEVLDFSVTNYSDNMVSEAKVYLQIVKNFAKRLHLFIEMFSINDPNVSGFLFVAFFSPVWLVLMKNVRHDCLLNPLICGADPFNHNAVCATNASSSQWGKMAFCLPSVSATLPIFYCFKIWFSLFLNEL